MGGLGPQLRRRKSLCQPRFQPFFIWALLAQAFALLLGKSVGLLPQSVVPSRAPRSAAPPPRLVPRPLYHAARCRILELCPYGAIRIDYPAKLVPDLAFGLSAAEPSGTFQIEADDRLRIGITLIDRAAQLRGFATQQAYEDACCDALVRAHETVKARIEVFVQCTGPSVDQDDRAVSRRMLERLQARGCEVVLHDGFADARAIREAYRRLDCLVASRMHAAVLALTAGVPVVLIGYQPKSCGMMNLFGLPEYCCDIHAIDTSLLFGLVSALLRKQVCLRPQVDRQVAAACFGRERLAAEPVRRLARCGGYACWKVLAGMAIGDQNGGAELCGLQLARYLDKQQLETAVFAMWRYDSPSEMQWLDVCKAEGIAVYGRCRAERSTLWQLRQILKRFWECVSSFEPDIVHSHSQRGDVPNILARLFHSRHPRAIRTVHVDQPWLNRPVLDFLFSGLLSPAAFDAESAVSQKVRARLDHRPLARLLKRRASLNHAAIPAAILSSTRAASQLRALPPGIPEAEHYIAVIGRLVTQKGHSDLVRALQIVCRTQEVHLLVIGSGPLEAALRRQTHETGLDAVVHFLGARSDALDIMRHVDMVVSPSWWEGFQTVILEAMATLTPVIATDVSGSGELVRSGVTGLLVPPHRPERIAAAILQKSRQSRAGASDGTECPGASLPLYA